MTLLRKWRSGSVAVLPILMLLTAPPLTAAGDALALGQRYASQLFDDGGTVWRAMTPAMRRDVGSEAEFLQFLQKVESQAGAEARLIRESVRQQKGLRTYMRYSVFDKAPTPVVVSFTFTGDDRITGFYVRPLQPAAPSPWVDYQTKADLRLPFDGTWYVFWGGRSVARNYHAASRDQRYAYDFVIMKDGVSHRGDGATVEDYYCWDAPILAPAAGEVVAVERLLPDNPPGVMDPSNPTGNHVMLDLGNGEFALLAHLEADSIAVKKGDEVAAGAFIGRCGNSGNTSEPHLHFHLQDSSDVGKGNGLPAFFNDYLANGEHVARGEPVQGQTVAPNRRLAAD